MTQQRTPGKPHPILAFYIDLFLILPITIVLLFALPDLFGYGIYPLAGYIAAGLIVIALMFYHSRPNVLKILTPGELFTGKQITDGEKQWTNPYHRNRWFLIVAAYLFMPNTNHNTLATVMQNSIDWVQIGTYLAYIVLYSLVFALAGQGFFWSLLLPLIFFGTEGVLSLIKGDMINTVIRFFYASISLSTFLVCLLQSRGKSPDHAFALEGLSKKQDYPIYKLFFALVLTTLVATLVTIWIIRGISL